MIGASSRAWALLSFAGVLLLGPGGVFEREAEACGGFFTAVNESELLDTSDQRVFYVITGTTVQQLVQVEYSGEVERLAWVYPISASAPPTVAEGADDIFEAADEASRPRFVIQMMGEFGDPGCSIGCSDSAAGGLRSNDVEDVQVWSSGQVGVLDYVVLSAESVEPLVSWLGDNGFAIPDDASPVLDHYVQAGWYFVAMRVSAAEATSRETSTSTVVFQFETEAPVFPLHMASMSSADSVGVLLYVLSDQSYETQGLPTRTIDVSAIDAVSSTETNYESVFERAVGQAGDRGFVREAVVRGGGLSSIHFDSVIPPPQAVLTRLRTRLDVADMTVDVTLVPTATPVQPTSGGPVYSLWYDGEARAPSAGDAISLASLGLFVFFSFRRLRRRGAR